MNKHTLLDNDPWDFVACDKKELSTMGSSGGTSGKSKLVFQDHQLRGLFARAAARTYAAAGLTTEDRCALHQSIGIAPAGRVTLEGLQMMKIFSIPIGLSPGWPFIVEVTHKMKSTAVWTSSAVAVNFTKEVEKIGLDPKKDFQIHTFFCSGMPTHENVKQYLEEKWGATVYRCGGSVEIGFLGYECKYHDGMHTAPDMNYWEVINPETGQPVAEGEVGETAISTLANTAMPFFRYQTDDLVKMTTAKCRCGRTTPRVWILGRTSETLFFGAHKVYGFQIDEAIKTIPELSAHYQLTVAPEGTASVFNYQIEPVNSGQEKDRNLLVKAQAALENLSVTFQEGVKDSRFKVNIKLIAPGTLPRTDRGKISNRIVDKREEI